MTCRVSLSLCGEVERPACLALTELRAVMDAELVADFHCREGWSRLGEGWSRLGEGWSRLGESWRGARLRTRLER
jgi:DMSO/TMAO reductase YedYZ molybdopterin-dependent catalytic subunit